MNRTRSIVPATLILAAAASFSQAGPLTPPPGPVSPTMKTLTEIEPRTAINATNTPPGALSQYRITVPGSYYLTENLQGASGKSGIEIATNGVTIDLNGYAILGTAVSSHGIVVTGANRTDLVIRNGSVRGCGGRGLNISPASNVVIDHVSATGNAEYGILVQSEARIVECVASGNGQDGIYAGDTSLVVRCRATYNGTAGTGAGITAAQSCSIESCTTTGNTGRGIDVGANARITECVSNDNQVGIVTFSTAVVSGCICVSNTLDGIDAGGGAIVRACECNYNGDDGIQIGDRCVVTGNTCLSNGPSGQGSGVFVLGNDCRIDDNQFSFNHYGVLLNNAKINNFIARNTATGNSVNFSVPANNNLAPVITNPGNSFTNATPWSNFAY